MYNKKEGDKRYSKEHKDEIAAYKKRWYQDHKTQQKRNMDLWRKENISKVKERVKKNYWSNREKDLQDSHDRYTKNREQRINYVEQWQKQNPAKVHAYRAKRRYAITNSIADLTAEQAASILEKGCLFCGTHKDLTIAHDTPVVKGGNTTRGNLFCLCRSCNSSMKTKSLKEILKQKLLGI